MSKFPTFLLVGLLTSLGLPTKGGLFGLKWVISTTLLDMALKQLVKVGVALGAGRPSLGLRLITDTFDRDWTPGSTKQFLDFYDVSDLIIANSDQRPWEAISPSNFGVTRKTVPWEWLNEPAIATHYLGIFVKGILWGFLHPQEAERSLDEERAKVQQRASFWTTVDPGHTNQEQTGTFWIDTWEGTSTASRCVSNEALYRECENLVSRYETERRPLVDTPTELLREPRVATVLGRFSKDSER